MIGYPRHDEDILGKRMIGYPRHNEDNLGITRMD